jgi:hypothetical protein
MTAGQARIDSIDAIKQLRDFLCIVAKNLSSAVDEADFEMQDTLNWVKQDRFAHWKNEERARNEQLVKAKLALKAKQGMERMIGGHDSCIDEKKALTIAQRRFEEAQEKVKKIRTWIPRLEKECFDCRAALQGLSNFVRIDLPNRRVQLDDMICSLESYTQAAAPVIGPLDAAVVDSGFARTFVQKSMQELAAELRKMTIAAMANSRQLARELPRLPPITIQDEIIPSIEQFGVDCDRNCVAAYDRKAGSGGLICFEHLGQAINGIEWFIGSKPASNAVASCTIGELLRSQPGLEKIFSLPRCFLVTIENSKVKAVFDADNKIVAS